MKRLALVRTLVCGLSWCVLAASAPAGILIDFDTAADGSLLRDGDLLSIQYVAWGVTFAAFDNGLPMDSLVLNDGPLFGNGWVNLPPTEYLALDILRIDFASPVRDVRWLMSPLGGVTEFRAYDAQGTLLEWKEITSFERVPAGLSATGIRRIEGMSIDNTFWGIDDLEFALVPEPLALALWVLGGTALWFGRRRLRRE